MLYGTTSLHDSVVLKRGKRGQPNHVSKEEEEEKEGEEEEKEEEQEEDVEEYEEEESSTPVLSCRLMLYFKQIRRFRPNLT